MDSLSKSKSSDTQSLTISVLAQAPTFSGCYLDITHVICNETKPSLRIRLVGYSESGLHPATMSSIIGMTVVKVPSSMSLETLMSNVTVEYVGKLYTINQICLNQQPVDVLITKSKTVTPPMIDDDEFVLFESMEPYLTTFVRSRVNDFSQYKVVTLPSEAWGDFPDFDKVGARAIILTLSEKCREGSLEGNEYKYFMGVLWAIDELSKLKQTPEIVAYPEISNRFNEIEQKLNLDQIDFEFFKPFLKLYRKEKAEKKRNKSEPTVSSTTSTFWNQHKREITTTAVGLVAATVAAWKLFS